MEDKTFELIEKMYSEFQEIKIDINDLKSEVRTVGNQVTKIENDLKPKVETALEGYQAVYEKLQEHDQKFDQLSDKIEKQDLEIRVIKAVKWDACPPSGRISWLAVGIYTIKSKKDIRSINLMSCSFL